jgi:5-amino-6-(5-phospho-D-ribitylamino)uracil phosphatase
LRSPISVSCAKRSELPKSGKIQIRAQNLKGSSLGISLLPPFFRAVRYSDTRLFDWYPALCKNILPKARSPEFITLFSFPIRRSSIKNRYKLLVVDIDGTIINKAGEISEADQKGLAEARRNGIRIALCTGRVAKACVGVLNKLSLDGYHIFCDGALVCDSSFNEEVYSQPIDAEIVRKACRAAISRQVQLELFSGTRYFVTEKNWKTDLRSSFFDIAPTLVDFTTIWEKQKIIKGGILVTTPEEARNVRDFLADLGKNLSVTWTTTPAFPHFCFINITRFGVSKGKALEALASFLQIDLAEVAAIGDGANDISLLSTAGLAIAMQNSPPELKAQADCITADVEESGVARAIQKYIF